jgi:hypothetical protein
VCHGVKAVFAARGIREHRRAATDAHFQMTVAHLPHELIVHIISCIGVDRDPDLRACGLVCHAWLEPARRAMFRTVRLQSESFGPGACEALLGLLDRTLAIARYIKEILWDLEICHNLNDLAVHALLDSIFTVTVEHDIEHRVRIVLKRWGKSFAVVLDKAPAIAPFVCDVEWFFEDGYPRLWTSSLIGGLDPARRLRHVRKLALFQVGTVPFRATAPFGKLSDALASVPVTQLCLHSVVFSTTAEHASFVSSFLGLQDLRASATSRSRIRNTSTTRRLCLPHFVHSCWDPPSRNWHSSRP